MKKIYLLSLFTLSLLSVFCQTIYTFTNAGAVGQNGPSQAQTNAAYAATNLNGLVTTTSGIQYFTVPANVFSVRIEAYGAKGGVSVGRPGGMGAKMQGDFSVTPGQVLKILVGQAGIDANDAAGGGGGSFVSTNANVPLVVAGGGSGATQGSDGRHGQISDFGYSGDNCSNTGSTGFGGGDATFCGNGAGGGGGFYGNGSSSGGWGYQFGYGFVNGGSGGTSATANAFGGFGGGAGTHSNNTGGGAGGGYTGGGASLHSNGYSGAGGSSFNSGINQVNQVGFNNGQGLVVITNLFSVSINQTAYNCNATNNGALSSTVNGGQAPFTYLWSNGETTPTISGLAVGTYSLTVTDNVGNTTNANITIVDPLITSTNINAYTLICAGGSSPSKSITSIEYRWVVSCGNGFTPDVFSINGTTSLSQPSFSNCTCNEFIRSAVVTNPAILALVTNGNNVFGSNMSANTYLIWSKAILNFSDGSTQTVIIQNPTGGAATETTQSNWCAASYACCNIGLQTVNATVNLAPIVTPGTLDLSVSGGLSPFTYLWSTGETTQDIFVPANGTYTVEITNAECGYVAFDTVTLTSPIYSATSVVNNCISNDIDVSLTNFAAPIIYSWSNGANTEDLTGVANGNYQITIDDASGCPNFVSPVYALSTDTINPVAICKDTSIYLNSFGTVSLNPNEVDNLSTDNCSINSMSVSPNSFTCLNSGANSVVLTVLDLVGRSSTCNSTVTVLDTINPTFISISSDITANAVSNLCGRVITFPNPTFTDNCSAIISRTDVTGLVSGDIFPVGVTTIEYTLIDPTGNITIDSFLITINDIQLPVITNCPANINVGSSVTNCGNNVNWVSPTASDNCPGVTLTASHSPGSFFPVGTTTVTYTAVDASNLSTTCIFTVTVTDNVAPNVPTLATVTSQCSATVTAPTTTDNCAGTITGTTLNPLTYSTQGTFTVVWTFNDGNGNTSTANQLVIVDDNTDPLIPVLPIVNVECGVTLVAPTTLDACAGLITGTTSNQISYTAQGTYFVLWTFNDGNGNSTFAGQTVIVNDVTSPVIPVLANIVEQCSAIVTAPTTTDNCAGIVSGTTTSPLVYNSPGTFTIVWNFNDGNGNSVTANQLVIVDDTTLPAISAPSDLIVSVNSMGCVAANVSLGSPIASDNCGIQSISNDAPLTYPVGTTTVTWTVIDNSGNSISTPQLVTVNSLSSSSSIIVETCDAYTAPDNAIYTVSGTYTSIIPGVFGCDSTIVIDLTINTGTDSTIVASDCLSYDLNGQTFTTSGIYTQILTNTSGCDSTITLDLQITGGDFANTSYAGDSTLVATGGVTYQWIDCTTGLAILGETNDTLSITSNGDYAVVATNLNGCTDTSDCLTISDLSVKQLVELQLDLYPNPTRDIVKVTMSVQFAEVSIYDAAGKLIETLTVQSGDEIDFRSVEPGVYFFRMISENAETTKKVVKQ